MHNSILKIACETMHMHATINDSTKVCDIVVTWPIMLPYLIQQVAYNYHIAFYDILHFNPVFLYIFFEYWQFN